MINLMAMHKQRFFSYVSLFTFFMLLLVSGANYFVMFVGWEGILECLKWFNINNNLIFAEGTEGAMPFFCNKARTLYLFK